MLKPFTRCHKTDTNSPPTPEVQRYSLPSLKVENLYSAMEKPGLL